MGFFLRREAVTESRLVKTWADVCVVCVSEKKGLFGKSFVVCQSVSSGGPTTMMGSGFCFGVPSFQRQNNDGGVDFSFHLANKLLYMCCL